VGDAIEGALKELEKLQTRDLIARRYQKFRVLGAYDEG
jgi:acetyl-CoA carboxylase alpha subunit